MIVLIVITVIAAVIAVIAMLYAFKVSKGKDELNLDYVALL